MNAAMWGCHQCHQNLFSSLESTTAAAMSAISLQLEDHEAIKKRPLDESYILLKVPETTRMKKRYLGNRVRLLAGPGGLKMVVSRETIESCICLFLPLNALEVFSGYLFFPGCGSGVIGVGVITSAEVDMMAQSEDEMIKGYLHDLLASDSSSSSALPEIMVNSQNRYFKVSVFTAKG